MYTNESQMKEKRMDSIHSKITSVYIGSKIYKQYITGCTEWNTHKKFKFVLFNVTGPVVLY